MIPALLLAVLSRQETVRTVDLSRGITVEAHGSAREFGYWDTSDTYIDGSAPDDNYGGETILDDGPGHLILIRFGDLDRVLGSTRHVRKATLYLTVSGGDAPTLNAVTRMLTPWNAGPYSTLGALLNRPTQTSDSGQKVNPTPAGPRWCATWRSRLTGEASWQHAGGDGPDDAQPVPDVRLTPGEKFIAIEGLGPAIQYMADHPADNRGFGLSFKNPCEFFSSRAPAGRPRLELELDSQPQASGPDLSVTAISRDSKAGATPRNGEEVTFTGHIKNVGSAVASSFAGEWIVDGKSVQSAKGADSLAPGAETTVTLQTTFKADKTDHRTHTVELRITPSGPDTQVANKSLLVYEDAKQIDVVVPAAVAAPNPNLVGSTAIEDWIQEQIRIFNDTYCAESRFSFAPDGGLERVSAGHIRIEASDSAGHKDVAAVPGDETDWMGSDPRFIREIGRALGLPDFGAKTPHDAKCTVPGDPTTQIYRRTADLFPGVMGFGDTRNETSMPGLSRLLYEPYPAPSSGLLPMQPTSLLSATDVAALNSVFAPTAGGPAMPKDTFVQATDLDGNPLRNLQLEFFQSKDGKIPEGAPTFTVTTGADQGTALLPNRGAFGPFGKLSDDGGNGTFLVRATANGVADVDWLKAWELIDTASRGNRSAGILELRFDLPSAPLDWSEDLAKDRIISDSTNQLPAKLGVLVSGQSDKEATLGSKPGDWVEIDLGKDRTIGEIALVGNPESFWQHFDIVVYSTGQTVSDAAPWASELDWNWAASNRGDPVPNQANTVSVAYRSPAVRIRFIRIFNRSASVGKLRAIHVVPVKIGT